MEHIKEKLFDIYNRKTPPKAEHFARLLTLVNTILHDEGQSIRPRDTEGLPGGLIILKRDIQTVIVPDLHARMGMMLTLLEHRLEDGKTVLEKLSARELQIVCVGDGVHSEIRAKERWETAMDEFLKDFQTHRTMDEEIRESFGLMEMVMTLKIAFPEGFHFLKGNHENISNENQGGNFPFGKFAYEGLMFCTYTQRFMGKDVFNLYYKFEKNLPLLAVGDNFLVSHAEPRTFFNHNDVINYRTEPEVIAGLTWTNNGEAEEGSVAEMINYYLQASKAERKVYFGGHRIINRTFILRAKGKYVQIHNPRKYIIALIQQGKEILLAEDIIDLEKKYPEGGM